MEELDEVMKDLKWNEKLIVKIFAKTIIKIYNIERIKLVNFLIL